MAGGFMFEGMSDDEEEFQSVSRYDSNYSLVICIIIYSKYACNVHRRVHQQVHQTELEHPQE